MQGSKVVKTFGVNQLDISAYASGQAASWTTLPLVGSGTLELTMQNEDVRDGEGDLDSVWYHSQDGTVTVVCKTWVMRALELISGNAVSSYGGGSGQEAIYFGTEGETNPPAVRLRLRVTAKDHNNSDATTYVWVYAFKATGPFPTFPAAEVTPGEMTLEMRLLKATDDDQGNTVAKCFGRLELGASS